MSYYQKYEPVNKLKLSTSGVDIAIRDESHLTLTEVFTEA